MDFKRYRHIKRKTTVTVFFRFHPKREKYITIILNNIGEQFTYVGKRINGNERCVLAYDVFPAVIIFLLKKYKIKYNSVVPF